MKSLELLSIVIQDCGKQPSFELVPPMYVKGEELQAVADRVCSKISDWIDTDNYPKDIFPDLKVNVLILLSSICFR